MSRGRTTHPVNAHPAAKHFEWGGYETWLGSCAFEPHGSEKLLDTLLEMVAEIRDVK